MILGDSLLVMTSLLEREGMAGKVQMVYVDPPYGINYDSNWQMKLNDTTVIDGRDASLSGEPEVIKAYRDTWVDGIHTYLSYLRDRLLVAKELLTESGSCFVQISDENVHLVRNLMDEIFDSENFVAILRYRTRTMTLKTSLIDVSYDHIVWYAKTKANIKFNKLFQDQEVEGDPNYKYVELADGTRRSMTKEERNNHSLLPRGSRVYRLHYLKPTQYRKGQDFNFRFEGKQYPPPGGDVKRTPDGVHSWATTNEGMEILETKKRLQASGSTIEYVLYHDDYPVTPRHSVWNDTAAAPKKQYVVQTSEEVIKRCMLMTTSPGDLVVDPTCGRGTTAFISEEYGRRWITIDTSRIALNVAKQWLMAAVYPYYKLYDERGSDIRQGFIYKKVPHITLESLANDEPSKEETLYDRPEPDRKRLRVSGPFTVETLQSLNPLSPEDLVQVHDTEDNFEQKVFDHLKSAGVKTGIKQEQAVFTRIEPLTSPYVHAEGFFPSKKGERKAYVHIGPKFGTVSKAAVNEAIKECRSRGDADWLLILGFSFESDVTSQNITTSFGSFEVSKIRMHDDLMQEGLLKKDKKAASFVTIAEPDVAIIPVKETTASGAKESSKRGKRQIASVPSLLRNDIGRCVQVEIRGLDIYDPIKDEVKPRDVHDIAYWMVDNDYDGSNFIVCQAFFCGSDKRNEFEHWRKGLSKIAVAGTKKKAEAALRIEIDDEAFERVYGHLSHPIEIKKKGQKIAVRVISQFGEESMKVVDL